MKMEMPRQINEVEYALLKQHPEWPQDKARWIAMQMLGEIRPRR
jgi:hypothetical protein